MTASNHFLDSLPASSRAEIDGRLERVELIRNKLIVDVGQSAEWVVLPLDAIVSVITVMADGDQVESRTIGRESGFGLLHALGSPTSFERVLVQVGGQAVRMRTADLRVAASRDPELVQAIVRHAQATIVQSAQFMACNTLHAAPGRLCRWLVMTQDRLASEVVPLTQEHLSIMLGVQRTTVTAMASALQSQKLIRYSRGKIHILDRSGLLARSCECYEALNRFTSDIYSERSIGADHGQAHEHSAA
jgi:CRP-like cAMP-binding protein